jgi:uncharacterized membrane protein
MPSRLTFFRLFAILGLAASAASLADQTLDEATFCSFESGCDQVTSSIYGRPFGIPLPVFGLIGFGGMLGLTLVGRPSTFQWARRAAFAGAVAGLGLVIVQVAVIGRLCPLCLVADVSAIAMGLLAVAPLSTPFDSALIRAAWSVAAVIAILTPLALAMADTVPDPPDWVKDQWVEGKVTIVEVTDFECEHCRRADEYIRDVIKNRPDVNLVRMPVPMPKHADSRPAAIAFHAAKAQGRGNEMAEALFAAKSLTPADCRRIAERLHLRMDDYDRVVADPATNQEVTDRSVVAKKAGPGVPLIWVQAHVIYGSPTIENFDGPLYRTRPYRIK